jgi:hypothetical protein
MEEVYMGKYKKIAIMFAVSYAASLVVLLIEFFYFLFIGKVEMILLVPILLGTFIFLISNAILKPHIDESNY